MEANNDEFVDMLMDDVVTGPTDEQVKGITAMARSMLKLETEIGDLEAQLEKKKKQYDTLRDKELPALMLSAGVENLGLRGGYALDVEKGLSVSLSDKEGNEKMRNAIAWLRANNLGSIVKNQITIEIPKGTDPEIVSSIRTAAGKLPFREAESVHTATFKATLREQMEKGVPADLPSLGAYSYSRAKLTLSK